MLAPTGGSITLETVLRFVDVATDALADAREEIDALNVFPVPDGDTGTNMFLTVSAARDAIREPRAAAPTPTSGPALAAIGPRRAARRARQLRGDPEPDAGRDRRPDRPGRRPRSATPASWPRRCARRPTPATPRWASRSRAPCSPSPAPPPTPRSPRPSQPGARARDVFTGRRGRGPRGAGPHPRAAPGAARRRCRRRRRPRASRDPRRGRDGADRPAARARSRDRPRPDDPGARRRPTT